MIDLRVLELLCARFCHEMVSPVGAINNGIELLGEDDPDFVRDAITLIGQSARTAARRLQFYRFAYGTAPTATGLKPRDLLLGLLEGGKVTCEWTDAVSALPLDWQRLACNLAVLAAEALPRGGRIVVRGADGDSGITVEALGDSAQMNPEVAATLNGAIAVADLTTRTVHGYVTTKFAEQMVARISFSDAMSGRIAFLATARRGSDFAAG